MSEALIRISQMPEIEERLRDVKSEWESMAADNMALVCTADTIQSVKTARADLTKKFSELEKLRKTVKTQYMVAYNAFEQTYKDCITDPYKRADADLKRKIDETEGAIKAECEQRCIKFFLEVCSVHGVDFVSWPQLDIKIDMTSAKQKTPSKLFAAINKRVAAIAAGMDRIDRESDPADRDAIMAEYKRVLDVGIAMLRVLHRKKRIAAEAQEAAKRDERRRLEQDAIAKVEAALPVATPMQVEAEPMVTVSFKATATREKMIALCEYMKQEGIKYE